MDQTRYVFGQPTLRRSGAWRLDRERALTRLLESIAGVVSEAVIEWGVPVLPVLPERIPRSELSPASAVMSWTPDLREPHSPLALVV